MRRLVWFALFLLLLVGGCAKDKSADPGPTASTTGSTTGGAPTPEPEPEPESLPVEKVGSDLRHEGFEYYGLGNLKPVDMEMKGQGQTLTGQRLTRLVKAEDGKVIVEVEHTDGLVGLGVSTYSVEKDGVYADKISIGTFSPPHRLEIPASLKPGASWGGPITLTLSDGTTIKTDLRYRVKGPEKVKTTAGEFDAILVTADGHGTASGQKTKESMKLWFAKGVGPVRIEMKRTVGKDKYDSTIEAIKVHP